MSSYFYYDEKGEKQGPIDEKQRDELVVQGIITPTTWLISDLGIRFRAGKHPDWSRWGGTPYDARYDDSQEQIASPWQFNFEDHLWTCKVIRTINGIVSVLWGIVATFGLLAVLVVPHPPTGAALFGLVGIVGIWVAVTMQIFVVRMICEWSLITSKAAQLYVEKCE